MLNFANFTDRVIRDFSGYLPEPYSDSEIELRKVSKVNTCLTGLIIKPKGKKGNLIRVCPTFYVEHMYEDYLDDVSFDECMRRQAEFFVRALDRIPNLPVSFDSDYILSNVVPQMVNTKNNKEMLESCPHREFLDLSVVYRVVVSRGKNNVSSFLVTNEIVKAEELVEEELFKASMKNNQKYFPSKAERIEKMLLRLVGDVEMPYGDLEQVPEERRLYVITNDYGFFGANAILNNDFIREVAEKFGTDCYILPSSINEVIILSANCNSAEVLMSEVKEINRNSVEPGERLSDNVYLFKLEDNSISVASSCA